MLKLVDLVFFSSVLYSAPVLHIRSVFVSFSHPLPNRKSPITEISALHHKRDSLTACTQDISQAKFIQRVEQTGCCALEKDRR